MRQRAAESDVVIVNHHLLCADAAVRQNAFGEVIPAFTPRDPRRSAPARGHRDAVLRLQRQHLPARGARARRRTAGRRRRRRGPHRAKDEIAKAVRAAARPRAGVLHRAGLRPPRRRAREERGARARDGRSLGQTYDAAVNLTGALDILESTLALLRPVRSKQDTTGEDGDAGSVRLRRTARTKTPRRWPGAPASCATTCASCCAATTRRTSTSWSSAAAARSCAPRRSTSPPSSASCCSIACTRRC